MRWAMQAAGGQGGQGVEGASTVMQRQVAGGAWQERGSRDGGVGWARDRGLSPLLLFSLP